MGLKYCQYISRGINIIATLEIQYINNQIKLIARPINKKLPLVEIIDFAKQLPIYESSIPDFQKVAEFYYWVQIFTWNFGDKYPKAFVTGIFSKAKTAESETETILYSL